jgi:phage gpG-like protein
MIGLKVSGINFDPIRQMVEAMAHPDLTPLAQEVAQIMLDDNREGLLAGTDIYGDAMAPIEESTRKTRGGDGPPLIPNYGASRAISDYRTEIVPMHDRTLVVGTWPNSPFIHFHRFGFSVQSKLGPKGVPSRDPVGLRPVGEAMVADALARFAETLIERF